MRYAEIILPIPGSLYTFSVDGSLAEKTEAGCAVQVQFGKNKIATGIVHSISGQRPEYKNIKPVLSLAYPQPVVDATQMRLWEWLAEYYMCTLGEVMRAALPVMFRKGEFTPYKRKAKSSAIPSEARRAGEESTAPLPLLTGAQQIALDELREAFRTKTTALLFGVPAGGKSEVCFHAIAEALARGRDVLLLLPELSLSSGLVRRAREVFGERVVLFHSDLTDKKKADIYLNLLSGVSVETPTAVPRGARAAVKSGRLVLGTRSAIFLPMQNLGLVVVDEEQDANYKQSDPAPRYNARDAAIVLAGLQKAKVILASATPSLETWANAAAGKYGLVRLSERYGGSPAPEVVVSDTLRSAKRGERKSHFNKELLDGIARVLRDKGQAIIFQNLRTFSTDEIEGELAQLFPSAKITRVIESFEAGEADILLASQMGGGGLDFARVSLVGILNADNLLTDPDFRASERAFTHIAHVVGRAGRRGMRGRVVIQSADPDSRIIRQAAAGDYEAMSADVLAERAAFGYPPYSRLISITLRHPVREVLSEAARQFGELLRKEFYNLDFLGPDAPVTELVKGQPALVFLLKIPRTEPIAKAREAILSATKNLAKDSLFRKVSVEPNIDPQ